MHKQHNLAMETAVSGWLPVTPAPCVPSRIFKTNTARDKCTFNGIWEPPPNQTVCHKGCVFTGSERTRPNVNWLWV